MSDMKVQLSLKDFVWNKKENMLTAKADIFLNDSDWYSAILRKEGFCIVSHVTGKIVFYTNIEFIPRKQIMMTWEYVKASTVYEKDIGMPTVKIFPAEKKESY
jgi:hypothetical protein